MKLLRRHNASRGYVETILHARVPIIKFLDRPTGAHSSLRLVSRFPLAYLGCSYTPRAQQHPAMLPLHGRPLPRVLPCAGLSCDMSISGTSAAFKCHVLGLLCQVRPLHPHSMLLSSLGAFFLLPNIRHPKVDMCFSSICQSVFSHGHVAPFRQSSEPLRL